jgi:hypothetical protein
MGVVARENNPRMAPPPRPVPTDYAQLRAALDNHDFPHERHWLDFKRQIYPTVPAAGRLTDRQKDDANDQLARNMASMALYGGFLVYGVEEDKANHSFHANEMDLPPGIADTVDRIARSRVHPPLSVIPTAVPNPDQTFRGFLVVEIPESEDAPHQVSGLYYGRTTTGKEPLDDGQVERTMLRRSRLDDQLRAAMTATIEADPVPEDQRTVSHFHLTALPTQPRPEMFLEHTRGHEARNNFVQTCITLANAVHPLDVPARGDSRVAFAELTEHRRSQRIPGAWWHTWRHQTPPSIGRAVGVEDDGTIRYIDLVAGTLPNGQHPLAAAAAAQGLRPVAGPDWPMVYEVAQYWSTVDMLRLVAHLADRVRYSGGWRLGVHVDRLRGRYSSLGAGLTRGAYDTDQHTFTTRVTTRELADDPRQVATLLMRPLFRALGSEPAMPG